MAKYVYVCHRDHVVELDRPYQYAIVGCQAMLPAWWMPGGYEVCGWWCWPKD